VTNPPVRGRRPPPLLAAVDVGTHSVRAGLFDATGRFIHAETAPITLRHPAEHQAVYRMDEIWSAVGTALTTCLGRQPGSRDQVAALAFDATSSLVLIHGGAPPLEDGSDVVCWMDHRGEGEAASINASNHPALAYVGGAISPEMHLPKLLWLKRHDPAAWSRIVAVRDLCDELATRASGTDRRSLCGLACKWVYLPHAGGWDTSFLAAVGLEDLPAKSGLNGAPLAVGSVHGRLSPPASQHLGLPTGLPVAVGMIDAEAGTLGVLGPCARARMNETASLIGGTSTCIMTFAASERRVAGVWGPFRDAVFPGFWMHESGQSLSGAALDAVIAQHPGGPRRAQPQAHAEACAEVLALLEQEGPGFAAGRHLVPDWLGNRAPLGNGEVRALSAGLGPETSRREFLECYFATARALAMQVRQIIGHLNEHDYAIRRLTLTGGHLRNPLLMRLYRDALGLELVLSDCPEPVLLGTAVAAACAAGLHPDLFAAAAAMSPAQHSEPPDARWKRAHDLAYDIYLDLYRTRNRIHERAAALCRTEPSCQEATGTRPE
jgi:D-ribulokinase